MHPKCTELTRAFQSKLVGQPRRVGRTKGHLTRVADGAVQAHAWAPFGIHGNEQGHLAALLVVVGEGDLLVGRPLHEDQSAHLVIVDQRADLVFVGGVLVGIGRNHEQLTNHLVQGQRFHQGVGPGCGAFQHGCFSGRDFHRGHVSPNPCAAGEKCGGHCQRHQPGPMLFHTPSRFLKQR